MPIAVSTIHDRLKSHDTTCDNERDLNHGTGLSLEAIESQDEHSLIKLTSSQTPDTTQQRVQVKSNTVHSASPFPPGASTRHLGNTTIYDTLVTSPHRYELRGNIANTEVMHNNTRSRRSQGNQPTARLPIVTFEQRQNVASPQQPARPALFNRPRINTPPQSSPQLSRPPLISQRPNGASPQRMVERSTAELSTNRIPPRPSTHSTRPPIFDQHANVASFQGPPQLSPMNVLSSNVTASQSPPRPIMNQPPSWINDSEVKLFVKNLPPACSTLDIYQMLEGFGAVHRIEIQEPRRDDMTIAWVVFRPPPKSAEWIRNGIDVMNQKGVGRRHLDFEVKPPREPIQHTSPLDPRRKFAEEITVPAEQLVFGVMKTQDSMLGLRTVSSSSSASLEMVMNLQRKCLDITFEAPMEAPFPHGVRASAQSHLFKMRLNFTQISGAVMMLEHRTGQKALILSMDMPPLLFRKTDNIEATHEMGTTLWSEWQTWYRQSGIEHDTAAVRKAPTQLQKEGPVIDIGRWLTYRFIFPKAITMSPLFTEMCEALKHHNINILGDKTIAFESSQSELFWNWLDDPSKVVDEISGSSNPSSELQAMAKETIHLPFGVRYQLEACVSHGLLHECNISPDFLRKLASMEPERAVKLLEKVADEKDRYYCPDDIFRLLLHKVSVARKTMPSYCALIRAATVTPTTIYFMPPVLETSNSIIRRYQDHQDRFLRVKFTDEKYRGKIMSSDDASMNEVFTRVKRTMTNGIDVGGRSYDFLAFGSSQFREGGAYFFAPGNGLTAEKIRRRMGEFGTIQIVAKYCARVGQSFSTTRATRYRVKVEHIPDIERNGHCFTDGVGKISPFLAQLIAQEHGLPNSTTDYPCVFQFRMGGCKGVLAVDPSLKMNIVQIRDSQEKFKVMEDYPGLNICRISQFSTAYLNIQLILVLSTLGIDDNVFLIKMRHMLADLQQAMHEEKKALELLQRNIDFNQMTLQLASMLLDGFMQTRDPFTISCLHLWRSWSIKYLKEKARMYVENGAFVLGCIDETGTLKGHFNDDTNDEEARQDTGSLPEIFLQIPEPSCKGMWKVLEGICVLARNPSLHPGDVRVVNAVNVPQLHHLRNCVVFPQTGDRDIPSMCSGGDLDGDDYLVMWDADLLPQEWNYPAMNYDPPPPKMSSGPVTVDDMTSFFVTHMKHSNVSRIAVAHRYWADQLQDGVKDPKCLELAELHSMAVDYVKTGIPAHMPRRLRVSRWPHWSEPKNKSRSKVYHSNKILGKLYDMVTRVNFVPAWDLPFDERILNAFELDEEVLNAAQEVKQEYDEAVRRVMAKFSIKSEYEVWTTFVLDHCDDINDYKFAETIGEAVNALKDHHQKMCYEKAGTTEKQRDWSKMGPFIAAMYSITAGEMAAAVDECKKFKLVRGQYVPVKEPTVDNMPFMSFPWLFPAELGRIATKRGTSYHSLPQSSMVPRTLPTKNAHLDLMSDSVGLESLPEVAIPDRAVSDEDVLDSHHRDKISESANEVDLPDDSQAFDTPAAEAADSKLSHELEKADIIDTLGLMKSTESREDSSSAHSIHEPSELAAAPLDPIQLLSAEDGTIITAEEGAEEDDQQTETVTITLDKSPLRDLEKLMAL